MSKKTTGRSLVAAALAEINERDEAAEPAAPEESIQQYMERRTRERAEAWEQAYRRGELDPISAYHRQHGAPSTVEDWKAYFKLLDEATQERNARAGEADAAATAMKDARALAMLRATTGDVVEPASKTTATSVLLEEKILNEFARLHALTGIARGSDVARNLSISSAAVSVTRNNYLKRCIEAGETPPSWAVSVYKRGGTNNVNKTQKRRPGAYRRRSKAGTA